MTNNTIFHGEVGVGTNDITSPLKIGGTGCMIIPSGTTGQRPTAVTGKIRYNTTIHKFEGRATDWHPLSDADPPPLYSFSSHTFTNAGKTGRTGPTLAQLRTAYASESWELDTNLFNELGPNGGRNFTNINGIQLWTIPSTGTYRVKASGAKGGDAQGSRPGGKGAYAQGDFTFTQGNKLMILVGQAGSNPTGDLGGAGGGGGTYVLEGTHVNSAHPGFQNTSLNSLSNVYVVGGGGGGCNYKGNVANVAGGNAVASQGNSANGGSGGPSYSSGGGAGYSNDGGGSSNSAGDTLRTGALGGFTAAGYNSAFDGGVGGYGGGGANGAHEGGGGAGYGGGSATSLTAVPGALGGTCRSNGNNSSFANHNDTHGSVVITKL